jgi:antitoxin component YwqK of YwqJK toxin-antitoxin module
MYGKLNGPWARWYADGKKEEEGAYKKGTKIGTWSRYGMNGVVIEEWNFDNKGRNLYEITYYDNGTVKEYRDHVPILVPFL